MRKLLAILATVLLSGIVPLVSASDFGELVTKLHATRIAMVDMTIHQDLRGEAQQKLVKETTDAVSAQLAKMKSPAGKEAQFKELVETWHAFKDTREKELIPALLKGDENVAKKLAVGIQKQRMAKCVSLATELGDLTADR